MPTFAVCHISSLPRGRFCCSKATQLERCHAKSACTGHSSTVTVLNHMLYVTPSGRFVSNQLFVCTCHWNESLRFSSIAPYAVHEPLYSCDNNLACSTNRLSILVAYDHTPEMIADLYCRLMSQLHISLCSTQLHSVIAIMHFESLQRYAGTCRHL